MKQNNTKRLLSGFLIFGLMLSSWSGVLPAFAEEATVPSTIDTVQNQEQSTAPELMVADQVTPESVSQSYTPLATKAGEKIPKPRKPIIDPVNVGDVVIKGKGLVGSNQRKKLQKALTVYVTVTKKRGGTETKELSLPPDDYKTSEWQVTLDSPLEIGDTIEAKQEFGEGNFSDIISLVLQETFAQQYQGKLQMEAVEVWSEDIHVIEKDAQDDISTAFKNANKNLQAEDGTTFADSIRQISVAGNGKTLTITFQDGSKIENFDISTNVTINQITETSGAPIIDDLKVTANMITGKISGTGPFERARVSILKFGNDESANKLCTENGCTPDKDAAELGIASVDPETGKFQFNIRNEVLSLDMPIGVIVKEYRKKNNCSKKLPKLVIPKLTEVRDPEKLTEEEKQKIADAIRKANTTTGGVSKLPDWGVNDIPALIEFHQDGVRIINPADVVITRWENEKPLYQKDSNGHYSLTIEAKNRIEAAKQKIEAATQKVAEAERALATAKQNQTGIKEAEQNLAEAQQALENTPVVEHKISQEKLIENLPPEKPDIALDGTQKKVIITPNPADTDAKTVSVTYTDPTGTQKTLTATKNDQGHWSVPRDADGTVDDNGLVTLPVDKVKPGTTIEAKVTDDGYAKAVDENNRGYKTSKNNTLKIEADQATQVKDLGGLDPVDLKVWVGDDLKDKWKNGVKVKDGLSEENKEKIKTLLQNAKITSTRTSNEAGKFTGKIKVEFEDHSVLEVENQNLIVYNHVIGKNTPNPPDGAIKIQFKLGEGVKVDNGNAGAKEGNKDNPVLYEEYLAKPDTNLATYKLTLPGLKPKTVFELINDVAVEGYVDPVWNGENSANRQDFTVRDDNRIFIATATKANKVTLKPNGGIVPQNIKTIEWVRPGENYTLPPASTFTAPENKEFAGWQVGDDTTLKAGYQSIPISGDTVVTAQWKAIQHQVTFDPNSGSGTKNPETVNQGDKYKLPPANTFTPPANQEFEGWLVGDSPELQQPGTEIEINGDTVVKAKWKPIQHQVSFNPGDGATGTRNSEKVNHGDEYTLPQPDTFTPPANQEFEGWLVGNDPVPKQPGTKIEITSDTLVTAKWKQTELTVKFKAGEGATGNMADQKVKKGNTYKLPDSTFTAPANKAFAGWKIEGSQDTKNVGDEITNVQKNLTLIAQWQPIQHQVTFDPNSGSGTKNPETVNQGDKYKLPPADTFTPPANQEFEGWLVGDSPELQQPGTEIEINGDTVVKAKWKAIQHQVTFDPNSGTGTKNPEKVKHGDKYKLPPANTFTPPANQEFEGWLVGDSPELQQPGTEIEINGDTVVKAKWKAIQHQVTFDPNSGTGTKNPEKVKHGDKYKLPPADTFTPPANQEFEGWLVGDSPELQQPGTEIEINGDTVVKAKWKAIQHQVTFDPNSGSGTKNPEKVKHGDKYKLPPADTFTPPANQKFEGWLVGDSPELQQPGTEIEINGDTVVKAKWKPIKHQVSFNPGDGATGTRNSEKVNHGDEYTLPQPDTFTPPANQEFEGWLVGNDPVPKQPGTKIEITSDTLVTAKWKQTELTVKFKAGEGATGNMADQKVKKGNTYKLPDSTFTAPANKAFAGWKIEGSQDTKNVGDEITNVQKNLTLIAQWKAIQHQVTFDPNSGSGTKNPETVNQGDKYKLPPADTFTPPANQEFEGWLVGDSPELQQPGTEIEINGDTVVKAKWKTTTPNPQPPQENVTIMFVPGEGSGNMASKTVEKGKPYKLPESTFNAPDGKIFAGWGIGDTGEIKQAGDSITVTENTTLTATWQDKPSQPSQPTMAEKVTALGGLDPVDLKVWVGDAIEWKNGVKAKMSLPAEKQDQIKALLQGAIITDESGRTSAQVGKYEGKLKIKFTDDSELVVDKQNLMVCNHVTAPTDPFLPDDAIEVTLQLGGGVRTEQVQPDGSIKITKKGDKDNPQTVRTLKVKPGTDLSTYTDGQLNNQTVFKSIDAKSDNSQYTPVWDGLDLANPSNYKVSKTNNVFRASAGARVKVTLKVGDNVAKPNEITNSVAPGTFKLPENPFQTPANQTFVGWKINGKGEDKQVGTDITINGDITLVAQWKTTTPTPQPPQEDKVSVTFDPGDNNATGNMPEQKIKKGQYTLPTPEFKVIGKTFAGWKVSGIKETKKPGDKITVGKNVVVTATWTENSAPKQEKAIISFQANGGQGNMLDASVEKGNTYKLPPSSFIAPVGKEFAGWKINGKGETKQAGAEITNLQSNMTLVAQWKDKPSSSGGGSGYVPGGKSQPSKPDTKKPNATTPNIKTPDKTKVEPPKVQKDKDGNTTITPNTNGNGVKVVGKDKNGKPVEAEVKKGKDGKWYTNKPDVLSVDPNTGKITVGKGIKDLAISSMVEMERGIHHKYLYGYPDRTVRPEKFVTRAEAAALIARLAKLDMSDKRKPQFKDTPSMWYNSAINIVVKKNLMLVEHGKFRPGEPITRAEFARALYYIDLKNDKIAPFADVKGHKFEQAINQAYGNDRIGGYPDGTFKPDAYIKRAEAAKMLNRFTKRGVNAEGLAGVKNQLAYFTDLRETYWGYYEIVEAANSHEYERPSNTRAETWLKVLK